MIDPAAQLDEVVDGRRHLVAREVTLRGEVLGERPRLRAAELGELHARFEHALPVGGLRHLRHLRRSRCRAPVARDGVAPAYGPFRGTGRIATVRP